MRIPTELPFDVRYTSSESNDKHLSRTRAHLSAHYASLKFPQCDTGLLEVFLEFPFPPLLTQSYLLQHG